MEFVKDKLFILYLLDIRKKSIETVDRIKAGIEYSMTVLELTQKVATYIDMHESIDKINEAIESDTKLLEIMKHVVDSITISIKANMMMP